jgi:hypothetical protein
MARSSLFLRSTLAPKDIADTLRRSIALEGVRRYVLPWFVRLVRKADPGPVCGVVERDTFHLRRQNGGQFSPNLYAKWGPEHSGTRIEGSFDLAPMVKLSLRITLAVMGGLAILGIPVNVFDLAAGTHFTKDPDVGPALSILLVPIGIGFYLFAQKTRCSKRRKPIAVRRADSRGRTSSIAGDTSPFTEIPFLATWQSVLGVVAGLRQRSVDLNFYAAFSGAFRRSVE